MESEFKFAEGERVLCHQRGLLYEGKVLQLAVENDVLQYYIHYTGWNKKWDEWVTESSVIKYTAANLRKQANLKEKGIKRPTLQRKPKGKKPPLNDSKDSGTTSSGTTASTPSTALEATASISKVTKAVSSARGPLSTENITKLAVGKDDEKEAIEITKKRPASTSTSNRIQVAEEDKPSTSNSNRLPVTEEDKPSTSNSNRLAAAEDDNGEPVAKRKRGRPLSKGEEKDDSGAGPSTSYRIKNLFGRKRRQTDG